MWKNLKETLLKSDKWKCFFSDYNNRYTLPILGLR